MSASDQMSLGGHAPCSYLVQDRRDREIALESLDIRFGAERFSNRHLRNTGHRIIMNGPTNSSSKPADTSRSLSSEISSRRPGGQQCPRSPSYRSETVQENGQQLFTIVDWYKNRNRIEVLHRNAPRGVSGNLPGIRGDFW